jgi:glycosyltransferase involved in cell wall biosynthesis
MSGNSFDIAVIIPANNEEACIGRCLASLMAQDEKAGRLQIVVSANGCTDNTEKIVSNFVSRARDRGWELICESSPKPGKADALNRADERAKAPLRAYMDADIFCEPELFGQLGEALDRPEPAYATGEFTIDAAHSWTSRAYAAFWKELPYVRDGAVGAGLFAVNAAGRARWGRFPSIIADDMYARLNFSPSERVEVPARYYWPMVEGLRNLVRVRRRQDSGVTEVYELYPALRANDGKSPVGSGRLVRLALSKPIGFTIYALVILLVRLQPVTSSWDRGR